MDLWCCCVIVKGGGRGVDEGYIYYFMALSQARRHGNCPPFTPFQWLLPEFCNSPFSSVEAVLLLHQGLTSNHSQHLDLEDSQVYQGEFTPHLQRYGSSSLCLCPSSSQICPCDPELSSSPIGRPSLRGLGLLTGFVFKHFMLTSSKFRHITPNQCFAHRQLQTEIRNIY